MPNGSTLFTVNFTAAGGVGSSTSLSFNTLARIALDDSFGNNLSYTDPSFSIGEVSVVPEPVNMALGIFGGVLLVVTLARSRRVRNRVHGWCVGVNQWLDAV